MTAIVFLPHYLVSEFVPEDVIKLQKNHISLQLQLTDMVSTGHFREPWADSASKYILFNLLPIIVRPYLGNLINTDRSVRGM